MELDQICHSVRGLIFEEESGGSVAEMLETEAKKHKTDGASTKTELEYLKWIVSANPWIKKVGEIGFNTGFSANAFLSARPDVEVVSFEIGGEGVKGAKEIIDRYYPSRHTLIMGDSAKTVPSYGETTGTFDLFFIDGGHEFQQAYADIKNVKRIMKPKSLVIIDDIAPWFHWGKGPTFAYFDYLSRYPLKFEKRYTDFRDKLTPFPDMPEGNCSLRSWIVFRYSDEPFEYKV